MRTANDIRVRSWAELNETVFQDSWDVTLGRFRSPFSFRGMPDASYDLKTSLILLGGPYATLEPVILRSFKKYAHQDVSLGDSVWNWLILAQHHGLPTRLLDWTFSPHVAMHFATADTAKYNVDGALWCIHIVKLREYLPRRLRQILEEEYAIAFSVDMLERVAQTQAEFDRLANEPFVIFLDPPSLDERIVNQFASFSMMSSPSALLNEWL